MSEERPVNEGQPRPRIVITYCTQCRWLLRATWVAQELLTTFSTSIAELGLKPGTGGIFRVSVDDEVIWDRKTRGGFPDIAVLKRLVRDRVEPARDLGHTDRMGPGTGTTTASEDV